MKVIKMIKYPECNGRKESIGGMGGFFQNGMRWKSYTDTLYPEYMPYVEAFREYAVANNIKHGGDWHQCGDNEGVPLFEDDTVGKFSYRAWGDIMAAIWSEAENKNYNYMDFYMDTTMGWGGNNVSDNRNDRASPQGG